MGMVLPKANGRLPATSATVVGRGELSITTVPGGRGSPTTTESSVIGSTYSGMLPTIMNLEDGNINVLAEERIPNDFPLDKMVIPKQVKFKSIALPFILEFQG